VPSFFSRVPAFPANDGSGLEAFARRAAETPLLSLFRIGIILLQGGMALMVLSLCFSIAAMNAGMVIATSGALLARAPVHRCVGFWPGVAFAGWQLLARSVQGGDFHHLHASYFWAGLVLAQLAFHDGLPGAVQLRRWVLRGLVIAMVVSTLVSLGQYCIGRSGIKPFRIDPDGTRFSVTSGFFSIHLTQGAVAGLMFFLIAGLRSWAPRPWPLVGSSAAVAGVALCGARSAVIGLCCGLVAWLMARGRRYLLTSLAVGVGAITVAVTILHLTHPERLQNMLALRDGRWPIWRTTVHLIAENPLFGTGGDTAYRQAYATAYPTLNPDIPNEFPKGVPHAHNTLLSLAAEDGIPLAILWLALLVIVLVALRRAPPDVWRSGLGMFALAMVFSQFERLDGETSRVLWTGLGLLLAAGRTEATASAEGQMPTSDLNTLPYPIPPPSSSAPG
jgi:hypothetical protein